MRHTFFFLAALSSTVALAEEGPVTTEGMATGETQSEACAQAFDQAEQKALNRLDAQPSAQTTSEAARVILQGRTDERLGKNEEGVFECHVTGTWDTIAADFPEPETPPEEPIEEDTGQLTGSVESIEGRYQAECATANEGTACRRKIENQARSDLLDELIQHHDVTPGSIQLRADGFEGTQSMKYQGRNLTLTMDGEFFFRVVEPPEVAEPPPPEPGTEAEISVSREQKEDSFTDNLDFTLSYTRDSNDGANEDELALSNNRWGVGFWVDNRFGFSAFWGEERAGIADSHENVHQEGSRYDVQGIGVGYRMFDTRVVTLENMLHFVDAQPHSEVLDPACSGCTARTYEAKDYYQASVNLKTNTEGLNVGWKLTWKLREDLSNYNSLSGGWYVELQF